MIPLSEWYKAMAETLWASALGSLSSPATAPLRPYLKAEIEKRRQALSKGLLSYQKNKPSSMWEDVWHQGNTRLLKKGEATGIPVLLIPSLINRETIFDINPGHSFTSFLREEGFDPYILSWGNPPSPETRLKEYLQIALEAFDFFATPPHVMGYCMGGLFATAIACHRPSLPSLSLLAMPWDFHQDNKKPFWETVAKGLSYPQVIPPWIIQSYFSLMSFKDLLKKYQTFNPQDALSLSVEEWVNEGLPLGSSTLKDILQEWYIKNATYIQEWAPLGTPVSRDKILCPLLGAIPAEDRIVPTASAQAFFRDSDFLLKPHLGHVGIMASRRAPFLLWKNISTWLKGLDKANKVA